jgi:hypothetical protein
VSSAARIAVIVGAAALAAPSGAQAAARVDVMVVGKAKVLQEPRSVALSPRSVRVGGHRCRIGGATPLSALVATRLRLVVRDYAACSRRTRDAGGLYVAGVGPDRARGAVGWVYKVGRRVGTTGAADPIGPFGTGRGLRGGQSVLWFWCRPGRDGGCQRTLDVRAASRRVAPGTPLRVTVRGYDDQGRGVPVARATVRLGGASALTGADGVATVTAPASSGRLRLTAERRGLVRAFGEEVAVG